MLTNGDCPICGQPFVPGAAVVRVELIYHVGNVHTEATERGEVAHLHCPAREGN